MDNKGIIDNRKKIEFTFFKISSDHVFGFKSESISDVVLKLHYFYLKWDNGNWLKNQIRISYNFQDTHSEHRNSGYRV